ncbi:MAG: hypothetical protein VZQ96_01260 [Succiniclasticum sp.]|nr:hypothetical protein [Succiniclasticum sp.]
MEIGFLVKEGGFFYDGGTEGPISVRPARPIWYNGEEKEESE